MSPLKIALLFTTLISTSCFADSEDPAVVETVNLEKYAGTWFEIGHNPNFFQGMCERSVAEYSINQEGKVNVLNTCYRNEKVLTTIEGVAFAPDANVPAKLVVDFGFLKKGDYWIIDLDPNYQWALVSGPKKESLFILARTAPMSAELLESILENLKSKGFDTSKIVFDKYSL